MNERAIHHHDIPDGTVAYAWSHGPVAKPLVMLHGLGDSAIHTFPPQISVGALANTPTLLIDLPGFGESRFNAGHPATIAQYADDVASLLHTLGIGPTNVFGHSMGGNVAIHLAHFHSDLVSGLIVAEPLLIPGQSILAADIARFTEDTFVDRRFPMLQRATRMQANRGDLVASAFLHSLTFASPRAMFRAASSLMNGAAVESAKILDELTISRTLFVGERTKADTTHLQSAEIRVIRIPNAGHNMLIENKKATTYAILELTT